VGYGAKARLTHPTLTQGQAGEGGAICQHDADISNDEGEFVHVEAESLLNANQADLLAMTVAQAMM
jgi:hypothetical protein